MTATIQRYNATPPNGGARTAISQATAVEQSRAIADVQAAVTVAQNCPRDMNEAEREMEYVCGRLDMAEQAFYQVTNRGSGPSVHLMRELIRIWGNCEYGVKELSRNDDKGESEVLATCWDMQKNTRSNRSFIVPHQKMKGGARTQLVDLNDIYLNNQNIGARAVRECIQTILPRWFTERAQEICRHTLEHGEGEPIQDRINTMVAWFRDKIGVTERQLETRIGRKRGAWTAADVAQMKIAGKSIVAGEASRDELFPPAPEDTACTADAAPAESKLRGKVKQAGRTEPGQDGGNDATQGAEPSGAPESTESRDQATPPAAAIGDIQITRVEGTTGETLTAPGAPTAKTPGQTSRVDQALKKAQARTMPEQSRKVYLEGLNARFAELSIEEAADQLTVIAGITKTPAGELESRELTDAELKQAVHTLDSWNNADQLADKVIGILDAADLTAEQVQQQTLDGTEGNQQ